MQVPSSVIQETFENEVVVVNMQSGHYFSMVGVAGEMWTLVCEGGEGAALEDRLTALAGPGSSERDDVQAFLDVLRAEGLIESSGVPAAPIGDISEHLKGTRLAGTIEKFTDAEGLLLLDPIHDVDDAGWPHTGS